MSDLEMTITAEASDDPGFVEAVCALIPHSLSGVDANSVYVVKIDNWFSRRWLYFSHKSFPGIRVTGVVVPPFVPERVVYEHFYGPPGQDPIRLHVHQLSEANARRKLARLVPESALFWWSGNSKPNGRGSLMTYLPTSEGHVGWYVELERKRTWSVAYCCGISQQQVARCLNVSSGTT